MGGYGVGGYGVADPPGLGTMGSTGLCLHRLVDGIGDLEKIAATVELDTLNTEKYVKELSVTVRNTMAAIGIMFEQESVRTAAVIAASGGGDKEERSTPEGLWSTGSFKDFARLTATRSSSGSGARTLSLRWVRLRRL